MINQFYNVVFPFYTKIDIVFINIFYLINLVKLILQIISMVFITNIMFEELSKILEEGKINENEIIDKCNIKREKNTIEIQKLLNNELETISQKETFKDYNPTGIHNSITELRHDRTSIDNEENTELNKLFNNIRKRLITSSTSSNKSEFETYKIINKCNTGGGCPYHICRVWFTLIPIHSEHFNCEAGHPVRLEWLKIDGSPRNNDTTESIINTSHIRDNEYGYSIPTFDGPGSITNAPNFSEYIGGPASLSSCKIHPNIKKWWDEWVSENRPF